jgi:hypothetical protein
LKLSAPPHTSLIFCLPKLLGFLLLTLPYLAKSHPMLTFVSLVASVAPTCWPPHLTSLLLDRLFVFLGYSPHHKGYRCLDVASNRIIISRHVVFDETSFPFAAADSPRSSQELRVPGCSY